MQHWAFEYKKYFPKAICQVIILDNKKKISEITSRQNANYPVLFITSYSMIERNESLFDKVSLKFTILDEGHIIKNTRTNKFKAVKRLKSLHRFILTGTPIQNRLIELWGLFDFLMPGYLYAEDIFKRNYERLFEVNLTTFKEDELLFSE
jgi:SNF2 family DNA or RNA helicase